MTIAEDHLKVWAGSCETPKILVALWQLYDDDVDH